MRRRPGPGRCKHEHESRSRTCSCCRMRSRLAACLGAARPWAHPAGRVKGIRSRLRYCQSHCWTVRGFVGKLSTAQPSKATIRKARLRFSADQRLAAGSVLGRAHGTRNKTVEFSRRWAARGRDTHQHGAFRLSGLHGTQRSVSAPPHVLLVPFQAPALGGSVRAACMETATFVNSDARLEVRPGSKL